jgi:HEAT repeat protein
MNSDQLSLWDLQDEPDAEAPPGTPAGEAGGVEPPAGAPARLMPPPTGTPTERLLRIMALRRETAPEAIGEMVAALGDDDEKVRFLAAFALQGIGGDTVVATLKAFIEQAPSGVGREEAEKVLQRLG